MKAIAGMLLRLGFLLVLIGLAASCSGRWKGGDLPGSGTYRCIGKC